MDRGESRTYLRVGCRVLDDRYRRVYAIGVWSGPILSVAVAMPGEIAPTGIVCVLSDSSCGEPRSQWLMPGEIAPKFLARSLDSE